MVHLLTHHVIAEHHTSLGFIRAKLAAMRFTASTVKDESNELAINIVITQSALSSDGNNAKGSLGKDFELLAHRLPGLTKAGRASAERRSDMSAAGLLLFWNPSIAAESYC